MIYSKKNGASQTEYILVIVLVAITVMFAVGQYGKEVKALFKKSTAKLDFKTLSDSDVDENRNKDLIEPVSSGESSIISGSQSEENSSDSAQLTVKDDNEFENEEEKKKDECKKRYNKLLDDRLNIISEYNEKNSNLRDEYNRVYNLYYRYQKTRPLHSWWYGWWYNWQSVALKKRLHNLRGEIAQLRQDYISQLSEWKKRMRQWNEECNSP